MAIQQLFGLSGRTALVTGGSSGIGRAIAGALASAGARVIIAARTESAIATAVGEINAERSDAGLGEAGAGRPASGSVPEGLPEPTGSAFGVSADLATRAGAHALADAVLALGHVDIVVNSAGINIRPPFGELTENEWDATMAVNLEAPFVLGQRLAPAMAERGYGRLIHISSQQAQRPFAASGAYGVSKAAVEALARSQAEAWSPFGVTANALIPGFVQTPLNRRLSSDPATVAALAARTLVGRNGTPEDFAGAAVFLAGPASAYVTGQAIAVDGGFSVH
ncbi:SDR family NAD(P)-dependent oxidoreductase [Leucobacter sp. BZR 635]